MTKNAKTEQSGELLQQTILEFTKEIKTPEQLGKLLAKRGMHISARDLSDTLMDMVDAGLLMRAKNNRYAQPEVFSCMLGTFCGTGRKYSFVTPDGGGDDIFIPPHRDGGAWDGDRVLIHMIESKNIYRRGRLVNDGKPEAEVYRVISESRKELVGTLSMRGKMMLFNADGGRIPEIVISKKNRGDAHEGDRVAVQVIFRGSDKYLPQGAVVKIFGSADTMGASVAAILHENDIPESFPSEAVSEARAIPQVVPESAFDGRLDLRDLTLFTIDGDSAKDFDDAVSLEELSNGHLRLGVHIADVSYYVRPGNPLDTEAFRRGTSVYYPGHVVPMLPFELSNGICSLNPHVNRLAFTAFIELDRSGKRYRSEFHRSMICSNARLTYNQVNRAFSGDEDEIQKLGELFPTLKSMNSLAKTLHDVRAERGALELNIPECEIICDEHDNVSDVTKRERGDAEHLIEEFMLIANEEVAQYLYKHNQSAVYRVHETPDPMKLREFARQARLFGYRLSDKDCEDTKRLQEILDQSEQKDGQQALPTLLLRSMARARYSPECLGHYGLAAKYYLHFTSPIRRYPDLAVHRMLGKLLEGQQSTSDDRKFCMEASIQSSDREIAADDCERRIDKLYQALYMSGFIGDTFSGYVSGVTNFGIFVALDNLVEGMVRLDTMQNDWFEYDPDHMILVGKHTGVRYMLGKPVTVKLVNASPVSGQIDFKFVE